jgi:hypothetical protein
MTCPRPHSKSVETEKGSQSLLPHTSSRLSHNWPHDFLVAQPEFESRSPKSKFPTLGMVMRNRAEGKKGETKETERASGPDGKVCDLTSNCKSLTGATYFSKVVWPFRNTLVTMATSSQVSSP